MTPDEKNRLETLETLVQSLLKVENVPFIENGKRRIAQPVLGDSVQRESTGGTSGLLQSVDEAGAGTYNVGVAPTGSIVLKDSDNNTYKIATYN